jgi:hypothetical protein
MYLEGSVISRISPEDGSFPSILISSAPFQWFTDVDQYKSEPDENHIERTTRNSTRLSVLTSPHASTERRVVT